MIKLKLKIGLFNESFPPIIDGVANTVINYARCIEKNHGEAIVVVPRYPDVVDDYPFEVYRYNSFPLPKRVGYRAGNAFSPTATSYLRNKKMDLYHLHSPFMSAKLAHHLNTRRRRVPIVMTYHTKYDVDIEKRTPVPAFRWLAKTLVKHYFNKADEVWCVSKGCAESLYGMGYEGDYKVMENGVDFPRGKADPAVVEQLRRSLRIPSRTPVFLFVGRMMWYKNIRLILDALDILKASGIAFRMVFVGDGADMEDIRLHTKNLKLTDFIHFAGPIRDREALRAYYSLADLFLFPSTYDTSGLVVKEAAACECPGVLIKGSCAAESVEHEISGFLSAEKATDFARVISGALLNKVRLKDIGNTAMFSVYKSWDDCVREAYDQYEALVDEFRRFHI